MGNFSYNFVLLSADYKQCSIRWKCLTKKKAESKFFYILWYQYLFQVFLISVSPNKMGLSCKPVCKLFRKFIQIVTETSDWNFKGSVHSQTSIFVVDLYFILFKENMDFPITRHDVIEGEKHNKRKKTEFGCFRVKVTFISYFFVPLVLAT